MDKYRSVTCTQCWPNLGLIDEILLSTSVKAELG